MAAAAATQLQAQRPAVTELQAGITGVLASRDFAGAGAGIGWRRPGSPQGRVELGAAAGVAGGSRALRVSGAAEFVLRPAARIGLSPYAGLGIAVATAARTHGAGYVMALLGVETAPGRPGAGWFLETGVAGGFWVGAGFRWRRFHTSTGSRRATTGRQYRSPRSRSSATCSSSSCS